MKAEQIIKRVQWLIGDVTGVRFMENRLLEFLGEAQDQIAHHFPEKFLLTAALDIQPNRQMYALPEPAVEVVRTHGTYTIVPRVIMDSSDRDWEHTTVRGAVQHVVQSIDGRIFVYPCPNATERILLTCRFNPRRPVLAGGDVDLPAIFIPAAVEWTLYRCYSTAQSDRRAGALRYSDSAVGHRETFFRCLGLPAPKRAAPAWLRRRLNIKRALVYGRAL